MSQSGVDEPGCWFYRATLEDRAPSTTSDRTSQEASRTPRDHAATMAVVGVDFGGFLRRQRHQQQREKATGAIAGVRPRRSTVHKELVVSRVSSSASGRNKSRGSSSRRAVVVAAAGMTVGASPARARNEATGARATAFRGIGGTRQHERRWRWRRRRRRRVAAAAAAAVAVAKRTALWWGPEGSRTARRHTKRRRSLKSRGRD